MSNLQHSRPWLLAVLLAASAGAYAATPPASTSPPADPANTGVNKRDAHDNSPPTADNQSNKQPDIRTAADVRKAIVDDKSLSVQAHNVKVLASNGVVTLRGPVNNAQEKNAYRAARQECARRDDGKERARVQIPIGVSP